MDRSLDWGVQREDGAAEIPRNVRPTRWLQTPGSWLSGMRARYFQEWLRATWTDATGLAGIQARQGQSLTLCKLPRLGSTRVRLPSLPPVGVPR
jgi:hypothetical protein